MCSISWKMRPPHLERHAIWGWCGSESHLPVRIYVHVQGGAPQTRAPIPAHLRSQLQSRWLGSWELKSAKGPPGMPKAPDCLSLGAVTEMTTIWFTVMFLEQGYDLIWTFLSVSSSRERPHGPYRLPQVSGLPSQESVAVLTELNWKKLHRRSPSLRIGPGFFFFFF